MTLRIANLHHCEWRVCWLLTSTYINLELCLQKGGVSTFQATKRKGLFWQDPGYGVGIHGATMGTRKACRLPAVPPVLKSIYHFKYDFFQPYWGACPTKLVWKSIMSFQSLTGYLVIFLWTPSKWHPDLAWFLWCNLRCWGDPWYKGFQQEDGAEQKVCSNDSLEVV